MKMPQEPAQPGLPRICVVGGGAGGSELVTRLGRKLGHKTAEILLVDGNTRHLWKPRLHEVAAGLIGDDDAVSYLGHSIAHGYEFHLGRLLHIDTASRCIRISAMHSRTGEEILGERNISYDVLVLALGSQVNDFGIAGVREYCDMLDSFAEAAAFQQKFLDATIQIAEGRKERLAIGIVGAGATGVELAAELYHAAHDLKRFGGLDDQGKLQITLIDGANRILPATDPQTSATIDKNLRKLGVNIILGSTVSRVTQDGLLLENGLRIPCDLKVWASGVMVPDLSSVLPTLALVKGGRIAVDDHLACAGAECIYAIGDCAAAKDGERFIPPTAQAAHQQASYLAQALEHRLEQKPVKPFRYVNRGTLISLGGSKAVGEIPLNHRKSPLAIHGTKTKFLYVMLYQMHRAILFGWPRTIALIVADWLRRRTVPPVKLH